MALDEPPPGKAEVLAEACRLVIRFHPPAERVLASCTIVGLPFSISSGPRGPVHAYFYQVALWLERDGRLHLPGQPLDGLACCRAPLILIRDACLEREEPIMVAASLLHEVLHLERYPIYTRKVLALVRSGLAREEAIERVVPGEEREVEAALARLAARHWELAEAMEDADLVEGSICLEDSISGRVAPWASFKYIMTLFVFLNKRCFRVHPCFGELRELLLLDARAKNELFARLPEGEREEQLRRLEGFFRAARELELSWLFKWSPGRD